MRHLLTFALVGGVLVGVLATSCAPAPTVNATLTPSATAPQPTATSIPVVPVTATFVLAPGAGSESDPVVEDFYRRARVDLAERLGVDPEDVTLDEWTDIVWPDSSLGCPQDDREYESIEVYGYRLLLRVADETYSYHTEFQALIYCDAEDVVLPSD